jgi:hypothetical protein
MKLSRHLPEQRIKKESLDGFMELTQNGVIDYDERGDDL